MTETGQREVRCHRCNKLILNGDIGKNIRLFKIVGVHIMVKCSGCKGFVRMPFVLEPDLL